MRTCTLTFMVLVPTFPSSGKVSLALALALALALVVNAQRLTMKRRQCFGIFSCRTWLNLANQMDIKM
jgi:hypothetical protein